MSKSPSNPSPYSPELQSFIVAKYDPLLGVVKTLNERLHATNRDKFKMHQRIDQLEREVHEIREFVSKSGGTISGFKIADEELKKSDVLELLKPKTNLTAPWLFSVPRDTPTSSIQVLLDFLPDQTAELDVRDWHREADLWIDFLENIPDNINFKRPISLSLPDIRSSARGALVELVKKEGLIVIRNVPGKAAAKSGNAALILVALLCGSIAEARERFEVTEEVSVGRLAVVLEGHEIGTKLRAGKQLLTIESLN